MSTLFLACIFFVFLLVLAVGIGIGYLLAIKYVFRSFGATHAEYESSKEDIGSFLEKKFRERAGQYLSRGLSLITLIEDEGDLPNETLRLKDRLRINLDKVMNSQPFILPQIDNELYLDCSQKNRMRAKTFVRDWKRFRRSVAIYRHLDKYRFQ
jgi:hypothetical protein